MFRIKSPQDFGSAIVFLLMGLAGLYFGKDLNYGSAGHMGPGYFPVILSWMIIGIGVIVGLMSLSIEGPPIEPPQYRPLFFVLLSVDEPCHHGRGDDLDRRLARREVKLFESLLLGIGLSIRCVLIFAYGLGQPLPAWWGGITLMHGTSNPAL